MALATSKTTAPTIPPAQAPRNNPMLPAVTPFAAFRISSPPFVHSIASMHSSIVRFSILSSTAASFFLAIFAIPVLCPEHIRFVFTHMPVTDAGTANILHTPHWQRAAYCKVSLCSYSEPRICKPIPAHMQRKDLMRLYQRQPLCKACPFRRHFSFVMRRSGE